MKCQICKTNEVNEVYYYDSERLDPSVSICASCPKFKYKIGFEDYDCDEYDGTKHYTGGPEFTICIFDCIDDKWIEWDTFHSEGAELIAEISCIESEVS